MQKMNTITKRGGRWYWGLCGLWCAAGAITIGGLLTYLTIWPIGAMAGVAMGLVLALGLSSKGAAHGAAGDDEVDLSERLRESPVYSDVPGNRFCSE